LYPPLNEEQVKIKERFNNTPLALFPASKVSRVDESF
jgi:hypothetical protein